MSLLQHSYVTELELLILDTLLPVYEKYNKSKGIQDSLYGINPRLLAQIKGAKKIPALLRAKETLT
jgi:hypothetical protein